ncbi:acyl-CoA dehydrogenase [Rhodomicrobium vannielii ATCC 17100]|uniref:acyl-CoA dehydrogenase n=1 Tax=Rhodomicrobium vannielii TaxID=1069 RepID=UPI0019199788|nr:acyl-CoA dehydrogenase [Rhodomicrobium vannielii]MBJ7535359.1 acyl-CoA dehydrogenase [Rhodomicrobium vannielii ATCC 17100]
MIGFLFIVLAVAAAFALAIRREALWTWAAWLAGVTLVWKLGLFDGDLHGLDFSTWALLGWLPAAFLGLLAWRPVRRAVVTRPAFKMVKRVLPPVSKTEQEALDAGTIGFDAEIFSGRPDWNKLRAVDPVVLTPEEQHFLDHETEELCRKLNDWDIRHNRHGIPDDILTFIREKGFLGMLISKEHGGLGFSPQAQSLILGKVSSRNPDASIVVMVPNSLGPGELIEEFGTDEQKKRWLEPLAKGREIPCFALTSPSAGSDAAAMRDVGYVTRGTYDGKETLGIRVTFDKRYITLAPKATLVGLAFHLLDPENILGKGDDIGITLALIPADHPGVEIGTRHLPAGSSFPNGPVRGTDVFIPIDWVVGGKDRVGQGWRMLMSCLAAGRAISLPASATAGAKQLLRVTSAYARVRKQFSIPIGRMEGIQEKLAGIVETAYTLEAARAVTSAMISAGAKPAVISAIMKYQSTERMRKALDAALDIHGGKGICDGPKNYLQAAFQISPVSITVEGANILSRSLIVFAQGALRSHPYLYSEIEAAQNPDHAKGFSAFEDAFEKHAAFSVSNVFGAAFHNITAGIFARSPINAPVPYYYAQLERAATNFALAADFSVMTLGGGLKVKQRLTGRLADALSELYFIACLLKRYEDDGALPTERPVFDYAVKSAFHRFYAALSDAFDNYPSKGGGYFLRALVFPVGNHWAKPSDALAKEVVTAVLEPGELRDRLTRYIYVSKDENDPTGVLEAAFLKTFVSEDADKKLDKAVRAGLVKRYLGNDWFKEAVDKAILTPTEADALREAERLVAKVIAVDDFEPAELEPHYASAARKGAQTAQDKRAPDRVKADAPAAE